MPTPKLNIELSDNYLSKSIVDTDIDIIPYPMAIYLSLTQEVYMNDLAYKAFDITEDDKQNQKEVFQINSHIFKTDNVGEGIFNKITTISLPSGRDITIEYSFNTIQDDVLGLIYIISFCKKEISLPSESVFSMLMVKEEISKLKANLNNEGKDKLNSILNQYFNKPHKQLSLEDLVSYERELKIIQKEFPLLSRREVLLCGLIAHGMELSDIAILTNRTLNSVFVTVHRINKKTDIPNKNELAIILQKLVRESSEE